MTPMRDGTLKSDDNAKIRWSVPKPDSMTRQSPMVLIFSNFSTNIVSVMYMIRLFALHFTIIIGISIKHYMP